MTTVRKDPTELILFDVLGATGMAMEDIFHQCHVVSSQILRSGLIEHGRVVRGGCPGVPGQHSWVVVGDNPFDPEALIVDASLWSYRPDFTGKLFVGTMDDLGHEPHGYCGGETIWAWGCPTLLDGEDVVELTPSFDLSVEAKSFLDVVGPIGRHGFGLLASSAPVLGWPSAEIIAAIDDTEEVSALVPIDRLGMLTNRNPNGLYFPAEADMPAFTDTLTVVR
jgi:hypothetical protein